MTTESPSVSAWTVSWFRAYDLGDLAIRQPREVLASGQPPEARNRDLALNECFDVQALRQGHAARALLRHVEVTGLPGLDPGVTGRVAVHGLVHASGFLGLRPTVVSSTLSAEVSDVRTLLAALDQAFWNLDQPLSWHVGEGTSFVGGVRALMNWVFLDIYERAHGRTPTSGQLSSWASEGQHGCERLHELTVQRRLHFPYPVSFGTQFEVVAPDISGPQRRLLARALLHPEQPAADIAPMNLAGTAAAQWYLTENHALTLATHGEVSPTLDVIGVDRTQLLEALTIRRGALRGVQRDTQRVLTERRRVSLDKVDRWHHVVASTTDNYVLHDRLARLIEPVRRHNVEQILIRDIGDLERQVRDNLAWFQGRIDARSDWTSALVGASVGTAAMVLSLQEPIKALIGRTAGGTPEQAVADHAVIFVVVVVALMIVSFVGSAWLIRRLTDQFSLFPATRPMD
ncbi:hypothetical protein [Nocardioides speluncae]|uniref:hypothetical protein n=1 Tax=Nocardioides speluncae TaxID=2670337 RepID=UPI000D698267|nr:hypothetical protein [Nocardioides speluncae]